VASAVTEGELASDARAPALIWKSLVFPVMPLTRAALVPSNRRARSSVPLRKTLTKPPPARAATDEEIWSFDVVVLIWKSLLLPVVALATGLPAASNKRAEMLKSLPLPRLSNVATKPPPANPAICTIR
jgi:hypothetical protein